MTSCRENDIDIVNFFMVLWSAVTWKRLINNNLVRLINFRNLQGKQLLEQNQINDVMNEKKGKEQKIWSKTDIAL